MVLPGGDDRDSARHPGVGGWGPGGTSVQRGSVSPTPTVREAGREGRADRVALSGFPVPAAPDHDAAGSSAAGGGL